MAILTTLWNLANTGVGNLVITGVFLVAIWEGVKESFHNEG